MPTTLPTTAREQARPVRRLAGGRRPPGAPTTGLPCRPDWRRRRRRTECAAGGWWPEGARGRARPEGEEAGEGEKGRWSRSRAQVALSADRSDEQVETGVAQGGGAGPARVAPGESGTGRRLYGRDENDGPVDRAVSTTPTSGSTGGPGLGGEHGDAQGDGHQAGVASATCIGRAPHRLAKRADPSRVRRLARLLRSAPVQPSTASWRGRRGTGVGRPSSSPRRCRR